MKQTPRVLQSKTIFENKYQSIKVDTLTSEGNMWEQAYFIKPNKNGAGVLALDRNGIYLVYQYRHASQRFFWQIPMGMIDNGSSALETAKKELEEEAGLKAKKFVQIGSFYAEPGMSNQEEFIYIATGLIKVKQLLEETEQGMKVKHFAFDQIQTMIKNGDIQCGFTLSALYLFEKNYKNKT